MMMLHAKKAHRMHLNVIENQLLIHLKDLYAFGMLVSAMRIELEASRPKLIGQKSTTTFSQSFLRWTSTSTKDQAT